MPLRARILIALVPTMLVACRQARPAIGERPADNERNRIAQGVAESAYVALSDSLSDLYGGGVPRFLEVNAPRMTPADRMTLVYSISPLYRWHGSDTLFVGVAQGLAWPGEVPDSLRLRFGAYEQYWLARHDGIWRVIRTELVVIS